MGTDLIQADYAKLDAVAARFQRQAEATADLMQRVQRQMGVLQDGDWIGRGVDAFLLEMERELLPAMQRLSQALVQASRVTLTIGETLWQAEIDAARPFQGQSHAGKAANPPPSRAPHTAEHPALGAVPPRDYALMSQAAYNNGGALPQELKAKGWKQLKHFETNTGYSGDVYVNEQTKEIVIAHRGTNPDRDDVLDGAVQTAIYLSPVARAFALATGQSIDAVAQGASRGLGINADGSDLDDNAQIAVGDVPDQYYESQRFVQSVQQQMAQEGYGGYRVIHTGHSLGAALADLHAATQNQQAITFDNPGSKEALESIGQSYTPHDHLSYQSHPNLINRANTQVGQTRHIRLQTESDEIGIFRDTLHDHSIDNMVDAMGPITGQPYRYNNRGI